MEPKDSDNVNNYEIIVRDPSAVAPPNKDTYGDWLKDALASKGPELFNAVVSGTMLRLKTKQDKETGEDVPPDLKSLEFATELLGLRSPDGSVNISTVINSNSNNTSIANGTSMESIIRAMDRRDSLRADEEAAKQAAKTKPIDADFVDLEDNK